MRAVVAADRPGEGVAKPGGLPALAVRPLLVVLVLKCGLNLAFAGRYGWQRDELYYAVAGRHLQGGYVEFPPVTALLSAAARVLFGWSLVGFRAFAILAGAATILLAALVARELGGGRKAQVLAAALVAFSPILLATNGLFQPVSFDQTATMLVLWLALRLALGRGSWLALGIAVSVGLETKYTLALVLVLLVAGFAVWRRDVLASRGLVLAVAVAISTPGYMMPQSARQVVRTLEGREGTGGGASARDFDDQPSWHEGTLSNLLGAIPHLRSCWDFWKKG